MSKLRIAIISTMKFDFGVGNHEIKVLSWYALDMPINLRDFDRLIIDLNGLEREKVNWAAFHETLRPDVVVDILKGEGSGIFVVGDVNFNYTHIEMGTATKERFLSWTGASVFWKGEAGNGVFLNPEYEGHAWEDYKKYLKQEYDYSLKSVDTLPFLRSAGVAVEEYQIFHTRYKAAIAFRLDYFVELEELPGYVTVLSQMRDNSGEIVRQILKDFCGADGGDAISEPTWASSVVAPGQERIDIEITHQKRQLDDAQKALEKLDTERQNVRRPIRLLYDQHKTLENIVKEVLQNLGGTVTEPKVGNEEEFWLSFGDQEGVVEVKSTIKGQVGKEGFRQVTDWVNNGELEGKSLKGILIINTSVGKSPEERGAPVPANLIEYAIKKDIVVITTTQLYELYKLKVNNNHDLTEFWRLLFTTAGLLNIEKALG